MLGLRQLKLNSTLYATLPPAESIASAFLSLGISVKLSEITFTNTSSLDEFRDICSKFFKCGREERHHDCPYPYMVRREVRTEEDALPRDLFVVDFGLLRGAIALDAVERDVTERI